MMAFDQIMLRTDRLVLRPIRRGDAEALFALRSNPLVTRYTDTGTWSDIGQATARVEQDLVAAQTGRYLKFGIERKDAAALIGTCMLFDIDEQCRRAEIGYDLQSAAWGNGYMNEALTALLEFAFDTMQLNRIEADLNPHNRNSIRALERLGFIQEGLLRERWITHGVKSDTAYYGLLHADWLARK